MELKVQSERVVTAASKCPDAKAVLTELFPEAFPQVFKPGYHVRWRDATPTHQASKMVVVTAAVATVFRKEWGTVIGKNDICCISLIDGNCYTFLPDKLEYL